MLVRISRVKNWFDMVLAVFNKALKVINTTDFLPVIICQLGTE